MPIGVFDCYQDFLSRANVHQGGHVPPTVFTRWLHEIQMDIYNDRVADFQKTQKLSDEITIFLESINVIVTNVSGQFYDLVKKPTGYENYASSRHVIKDGKSAGCKGLKECDGVEVKDQCQTYVDPDEIATLRLEAGKDNCEVAIELVDNSRWSSICNNPRKKLTCQTPKLTQYSAGFKLAPKGCMTNIIMDFFRLPKKPIFNFTVINPQQENEYYLYVALGSQDLEWSEQLLPTFMAKLLDKYAIFVGNDTMWTQAKTEQKEK